MQCSAGECEEAIFILWYGCLVCPRAGYKVQLLAGPRILLSIRPRCVVGRMIVFRAPRGLFTVGRVLYMYNTLLYTYQWSGDFLAVINCSDKRSCIRVVACVFENFVITVLEGVNRLLLYADTSAFSVHSLDNFVLSRNSSANSGRPGRRDRPIKMLCCG